MTTLGNNSKIYEIIKFLCLAVMFSISATISGCASSSVSTSTDEGNSTSTSFFGKDEGLLVKAREQRMAGNYDEAIRFFEQLANNPSADSELKAEALLEIGHTYSSLMNQQRNFAKAEEYYLQVVENYPDTQWQKEAQKSLDSIEPNLKKD